MPRKKGFTLVELLVVVAIIALLIAILVPALKKSQKQARAVVCQSNLKQWATITHMYTLDHDSRFWHHVGMLGGWMEKLEPYYGKTDDFRTCPEATEDCVNIDPPGTANREFRGSVDTMWGIRGIQHEFGGREEGYWGSYGLNAWVTTPMPGAVDTLWDSARWKTTAVKGAANVPVFLDSMMASATPLESDEPPLNGHGRDEESGFNSVARHMRRFCIDRHSGAVNSCFIDCSVRRVHLTELWTLEYYRGWRRTTLTKSHFDTAEGFAPNPSAEVWLKN